MPQPTTRRERYLFFRSRAALREIRSVENRPRPGDNGHHTLNRSRDTRGVPKQADYSGTPKGPWLEGYWDSTPDADPLKGTYQKPGIVLDNVHPFPGWSPNSHVRDRVTNYYMRRQKRLPMLRNLPLRPIGTPTGDHAFMHFYPFFRYPSGALNPNWWKGEDDFGNPPPPH